MDIYASFQFNHFKTLLKDKQAARFYLRDSMPQHLRPYCDLDTLRVLENNFYGDITPPKTTIQFLYQVDFNKQSSDKYFPDDVLIANNHDYLYFLVEFQLTADADSGRRLAHYCFNVMRQDCETIGEGSLPIVVPVTMTLSGEPNRQSPEDMKRVLLPLIKSYLEEREHFKVGTSSEDAYVVESKVTAVEEVKPHVKEFSADVDDISIHRGNDKIH